MLALLQLSDSALPTGAFSHSGALEAFVAAGLVRDVGGLRQAVLTQLEALGTADVPALRAAHGCADLAALVALDRRLGATKLAREARQASAAQGRSLLATVEALGVNHPLLSAYAAAVREGSAAGHLAPAYGMSALALGLDAAQAALGFVWSATVALVQAGQKLIPLGARAAQRVLFELHEVVERVAASAHRVDDLFAWAPLVDVMAMGHERQRTRLFVS